MRERTLASLSKSVVSTTLVGFGEDPPRLRGVLVSQVLELGGEGTAVQIDAVQVEVREPIGNPLRDGRTDRVDPEDSEETFVLRGIAPATRPAT